MAPLPYPLLFILCTIWDVSLQQINFDRFYYYFLKNYNLLVGLFLEWSVITNTPELNRNRTRFFTNLLYWNIIIIIFSSSWLANFFDDLDFSVFCYIHSTTSTVKNLSVNVFFLSLRERDLNFEWSMVTSFSPFLNKLIFLFR